MQNGQMKINKGLPEFPAVCREEQMNSVVLNITGSGGGGGGVGTGAHSLCPYVCACVCSCICRHSTTAAEVGVNHLADWCATV